jgi:histidine kinase
MKIRTRLFLSYLGMMFIPVVLLGVIGFFLRPYFPDEDLHHPPRKDLIHHFLDKQRQFLNEMERNLVKNPDLLYDEDFWNEAEDKLIRQFSLGEVFPGRINPFISSIIIIILTNSILTFLISKSIIKPLNSLKGAAERIKEGELDEGLSHIPRDEFGPVMKAFEEMRKRLKDSLESQLKYEEGRKELISSITHDLRTPITSIKGYVEGIREGVAATKEKQDKYLDTIFAKAVILEHLVDQLSLFSRLDTERIDFDFRQIDMIALIREALEEAKNDFTDLKAGLDNPGIDELQLKADKQHMKRVFVNLIENSIKYNDKECKEITVVLNVSEKDAIIEVRDNGPGIDEKALPHIFERFFRADPSRSSKVSGSGLGLAISKQIVIAHGGKIWAENRPEGGVSVFFSLPLNI